MINKKSNRKLNLKKLPKSINLITTWKELPM